jgi:phage-related holin
LLLTFSAIVVLVVQRILLEAVEADLLSVVAADVVAELVVARSAEVVTVTPVVVLGAHQPVMVARFSDQVKKLRNVKTDKNTFSYLLLGALNIHLTLASVTLSLKDHV